MYDIRPNLILGFHGCEASVRDALLAFPGSGLFAKSHIQICVRNPNCIKGFFMPRRETDFASWLEENKRA